VSRRTSRKKWKAKIKALNRWLRAVRNVKKVAEWWAILAWKMVGHYQYYGVSENYRGVWRYYQTAIRLAFKWINRRSQRKSYSWEEFERYLAHYPLPRPRLYHNLYTLANP